MKITLIAISLIITSALRAQMDSLPSGVWNELVVKKTSKGESRPVFDRPSSMFPRFEVHATTLHAGEESHPPHSHRAEEIMLLMKGTITMNIASVNYKAVTGDVIFVRPDVLHNLKNTGNEPCWYYAIKWFNEVYN